MAVVETSNRTPPGRSCGWWSIAEGVAWTTGLVLLLGSSASYVESARSSRREMERFARVQEAALQHTGTIDPTYWSEGRLKAWRRTTALPTPAPLAILRIPRVGVEVPVLEGTEEATLNRAVGHIEATAGPGMDGNSGIAGHRDGFFRPLKDVVKGDVIEIETTRQETEIYRVERTWIVSPEEIWVLDPTSTRSLTLVTCYPFYFVGPAPKRYIVRAVLAEAGTTRTAR